jgi:hypothetical protein
MRPVSEASPLQKRLVKSKPYSAAISLARISLAISGYRSPFILATGTCNILA